MHDFTSDGTLPEALTSMHVVKTPQARAAQLAADCHEVRATIGMANIESRYPKDLHFLHQADTSGERNTTHAMLLLPTNEAEGIKMSSLEESIGLRTGTYQDVPIPTEWITVSQKAAMQAKRKMVEAGMKVKRTKPSDVGFASMHAKALAIDNRVLLTGNVNITHNSIQNNVEHMVAIYDPLSIERSRELFDDL